MDQLLEVTNVKNESIDSTSNDRLQIPITMHMNSVKQASDSIVKSKMKTESQENMSVVSTSEETYNNVKFTTIKIEYEDTEKHTVQDFLNVGDEIKVEEHCPVHLDQGETRIKTIPTEGENDENILKTDEDIHSQGSGFNPDQDQLLVRNDSDGKDKKYVCNKSDKIFTMKCNLNHHLFIHASAKPYICEICKKSFTLKQHLVDHMLIHSGKKSHVCDVCKKVFTIKSNLTAHMLFHSGERTFSCNFCNKLFVHKAQLVMHIRIHTGEKPFACDFCKKTFTHKSSLTTHIRSHTGEKPFSCDFCYKSFTQKTHLNRHKKIHKN